ncbi:aspartate aminotransferase family protein [Pseudemcibacter aquimaris]|uniref:aminotransferase family protein n=1 Tax=Pseudemcibacter aquimaris TaxID=2857064 RepID=UPI002012F038|nr:aspartate aminotransferase family protein [Pseudemcibacter aquimaris]MCC3859994.1 aspartate aminotransferase family protein [Pseudemcibacter aquimaris]WDU57325.1 aspartate aminotransferase family protein [Pseudemcibacter aquimaris]
MKSHLFYQTRDRKPMLDRAEGIYMWDVNGKRYIDGSSGAMVSNIGHSNENVLAAMKAQMEKSTFGYRLHFENEPAEKLASRVAELSPDGHDKIFFVSGGSEAVESAVKLARQCAYARGDLNKTKVISRSPSYHGGTMGALSLTSYGPLNDPFKGMTMDVPHIPSPSCYLDTDDLPDDILGLKYADYLYDKILEIGADNVLAFIMEPVGGASTGALVAPDSYYKRIRDICDEFGIFLIYDEVMTGVGRTGKFLACEHWNINPDIIATSKGFGAGYVPLGAMTAKQEIVDTVLDSGGFQHGYTYAGNPIACAAGLAVIDEIYNQNMMENCAGMGDRLIAGLNTLMNDHDIIGDVRGKGLLTAFELVSDRETMEPLAPEKQAFSKLVNIAYDKGLIIYSRRTRGGYSGDHFLVCPPMIVTEEQIDDILSIINDSLNELNKEL